MFSSHQQALGIKWRISLLLILKTESETPNVQFNSVLHCGLDMGVDVARYQTAVDSSATDFISRLPILLSLRDIVRILSPDK